MTWRTPSSLKWLIVRYSRQQGALSLQERQAKKLQEQLDAVLCSIAETKANLEAIERTLTLHEIQISAAEIEAVMPQVNRRLYTFGELTRRIYAALRESGDWSTTEEVIRRVTGLSKASADPVQYRHVRSMLRGPSQRSSQRVGNWSAHWMTRNRHSIRRSGDCRLRM